MDTSNKNPLVTNITVVIRSSHERTEQFCQYLLLQQIPQHQIIVIQERPFYKALQRGYEAGVEAGREWTLFIDADMLVLPQSISKFMDYIKRQPGNILGASGLVLDKLRICYSRGGQHLYRTELLEKALVYTRDTIRFTSQIRPETYIKHRMDEIGFPWVLWDGAFGIHDFEQYYSDIYRKMVVRANKSDSQVQPLLRKMELLSVTDPDYLVGSWGLRVGPKIVDTIRVDSEQWREEAALLMKAHGIEEKQQLNIMESDGLVESRYQQYKNVIYPTRGKMKSLISQFLRNLRGHKRSRITANKNR